MRLRFPATLNLSDYTRLNITKADDLLVLQYTPVYRDKVRTEMRKIVEKNAKNKETGKPLVELLVDIDIRYQRRSLDANRWMWAVHDLECRIINGKASAGIASNGLKWVEADKVTPEMIHDDYLEQYAKKYFIYAQAGMVNAMREVIEESIGRILEEKWLPEREEMQFLVWKTSRFMNAAEFYEFSEHIKNQLFSYGIDIDNAVDFETLMSDRETIYKEMVHSESKEPESISNSQEKVPIPVLLFHKDSATIVQNVFGGDML